MKFKDIEILIDNIYPEIIQFRRDLHQYPELGGEEARTSSKILEQLSTLPLEVQSNVGGYGVLATLFGEGEGKTILIRGDMDALSITEDNDLPFASKIPNVMHACGHDMHTSIVLGTAFVLSQIKDKLKGNIKFMFQPSEEVGPTGGSRQMIEAGILENPTVDEAYALHVYQNKTGTVAIRPGVANSKSDRITIEIFGKSSHGSLPHEGNDAMLAAANLITSIQSIVSRNLAPGEEAVISLGTIEGGNRYNVIADYIKLDGTVRTFSDNTSIVIKSRLEKLVSDISSAYGCTGKLHYVNGYDFIFNDLELSNNVISSLSSLIGKNNIIIQPNPLPAGEDFSFISKKVPSVFLWLGTEGEHNTGRCILHNPNFLADEESLRVGIKVFSKIILNSLGCLD